MLKKLIPVTLVTLLAVNLAFAGNYTDKTGIVPENLQKIRDYMPDNSVIAHRGSTYWTPEETEAAYRWARNMGADYLEADLQITKDGIILALHDDNLKRTTNITIVYPDRADQPASSFTYEELLKLDAGTWFNKDNPTQAKKTFTPAGKQKQYISTLEDLIMYSKGYKLKRNQYGERLFTRTQNADGTANYKFEYVKDEADNGNRPGLYIETKEPHLNPGLEEKLVKVLDANGVNIMTKPATSTERFVNGKINVGNTSGKIILQTFSIKSLGLLNGIFKGQIPTCFLFWFDPKGGENDMKKADKEEYAKFIKIAIDNNAVFIGPSIAGEPNNYDDLLKPWQSKMIREAGLKIHPYSFDSEVQMKKYQKYSDAMFTNRSDLTNRFYNDKGLRGDNIPVLSAEKTLTDLGYKD